MMVSPSVLRALTAVFQISTVFIVLLWIQRYLGGFALHPKSSGPAANDTGALFNWHPFLMTLAFPLVMAQGVLAYRDPWTQRLTRPHRKALHATVQALALTAAVLGVTAAWKSHTLKRPEPIPNLYSAHSYLGVLTLSMAIAQLLLGFYIYVWPNLSAADRKAAYGLHAFFGASTFITALATMLAGIQEKATFVNLLGKAGSFSPAVRLPAVLGLFIVVTGILVFSHHAVLPRDRQSEEQLLNTDDRSV